MKQMLYFILAWIGIALFAAEPPLPTNLSQEELEAKRAAKKLEIVKRAGGYARKTDGQKGRIVFANNQDIVPLCVIENAAEKIGSAVKMAVDVVPCASGEFNRKAAGQLLKDAKANGVIYLSADEGDEPVIVAPEGRWAKINVALLKGDKADSRVQKEMVRAFIILCGGGTSDLGHPILDAISGVDQLDAVPYGFPQDVIGRLERYMAQMGVTPYYQTTYRRACHLGWAPPPTNDVQRAIWEKIKAEKERGPTKPITIPPPNAKK